MSDEFNFRPPAKANEAEVFQVAKAIIREINEQTSDRIIGAAALRAALAAYGVTGETRET